MTTPKQTIFNPAQFKAPSSEDGDKISGAQNGAKNSEQEKKEYNITGNASRDQVRKFIFESFLGDKPVLQEALSVGQVVESIENAIFGK